MDAALKQMLEVWLDRRTITSNALKAKFTASLSHLQAQRRMRTIEEDIILKYPGQRVTLPDGRSLKIGRAGCVVSQRMILDTTKATNTRKK